MLRITRLSTRQLVFLRFNSSVTSRPDVARPEASQLTKKDLQSNAFANQAPNRNVTWSPSQEERIEIISKEPFDNSMTVLVNDQKVNLSAIVCRNIYVAGIGGRNKEIKS